MRDDAQAIEEARILALSLRVADALRKDPVSVMTVARRNVERWGWLSRQGGPRPEYERRWLALLDAPVEHLLAVLEAPLCDERATHLRSTQPFAGVVGPTERWQIRARFRELLDERGYARP